MPNPVTIIGHMWDAPVPCRLVVLASSRACAAATQAGPVSPDAPLTLAGEPDDCAAVWRVLRAAGYRNVAISVPGVLPE